MKKFRAWDIDNEVMIYSDDPRYLFMCGSNGELGCWERDDEILNELHLSPILQYTGLQDKNGKEIYEGGIVRWKRVEEDYQEHRGDNIPYGGYFREHLGFNIVTLEGVVTFKNGAYWAINEDEDKTDMQLDWITENDIQYDYDAVIKHFTEDDYYRESGYESMEQLLSDVQGFEQIGNLYESPHLLDKTI